MLRPRPAPYRHRTFLPPGTAQLPKKLRAIRCRMRSTPSSRRSMPSCSPTADTGASTANLIARHTPIVVPRPRLYHALSRLARSATRPSSNATLAPTGTAPTTWNATNPVLPAGWRGHARRCRVQQYEGWVEYGQETTDVARRDARGWMSHYTRRVHRHRTGRGHEV